MIRPTVVGVLAEDLTAGGPAQVLSGIFAEARLRGIRVEVAECFAEDDASVRGALEFLLGRGASALLATAQTSTVVEVVLDIRPSLPLVINPPLLPDGLTTEQTAGRLQAEHLARLGHTRVGYLQGAASSFAAHDRTSSFAQRMEELGGQVVWSATGDWSGTAGFFAAQTIVDDRVPVTAIATANDSMAVGVIRGLEDAGVRVPQDMSVVGIDDLPDLLYFKPSLTTVRLDFRGEGRYLLAATDARTTDAVVIELPKLVERASTAPLRSS